jgi:hypothetical protein
MKSPLERRIAEMEAKERIYFLTIGAGETRAQALARKLPYGRPGDTDIVFLSWLGKEEPDDPA